MKTCSAAKVGVDTIMGGEGDDILDGRCQRRQSFLAGKGRIRSAAEMVTIHFPAMTA